MASKPVDLKASIALACALQTLQALPALADDNLCKEFGDLAQSIMEDRQTERAMSDVMAAYVAAAEAAGAQEMVRRMVIAAYDEPGYSVPENRQHAAAEFRNRVELECFKSGQ